MRRIPRAFPCLPVLVFAALLQVAEIGLGQAGTGLGLATVGNSGADKNGSDDVPFRDAMGLLPSRGGTIYVFAGNYSFDATVNVIKPVRFVCQPGVVIQRNIGQLSGSLFDFGQPTSGLIGATILLQPSDTSGNPVLSVSANNFELSRVTIVDEETTQGTSLVRVNSGNGLTITDCVFEVTATDTETFSQGYIVLDIGRPDTAVDFTRFGAFLHNNLFVFNDEDNNEHAVAIRSENGRALRVIGNQFRSVDPKALAPSGRIKIAVEMVDELDSIVADNTIRFLGQLTDTTASLAEALIRVENDVEADGPNCVIMGNLIESCAAEYAFDFLGARSCVISGNMMGRAVGAVRLTRNGANDESQSIVMMGNQFHNVGNSRTMSTDLEVPVLVEHSTNVSMVGNQFTLCPAVRSVEFMSSVDNTVVSSNQFVRNSAIGGIPEAVLFNGGAGHLAHDNSALKNGANGYKTAVEAAGIVTPANKSVLDNYDN